MTDEFKVQILNTEAQWQSGLSRGLRLGPEGIALFANPAFDSWLTEERCGTVTGDIVVDECGQIYWSQSEPAGRRGRRVWSIFRHDPRTGQTERLVNFGDCGRIEPRKLWLRPDYLWLLDRGEEDRLLALSRINSQIVYELDVEGRLLDLDFDPAGVFYALVERGGARVCAMQTPPLSGVECFASECWRRPAALAVGRAGVLYLLDVKAGLFVSYDPRTRKATRIGKPSRKLLRGFEPSVMEIDERGVIFLAGRSPRERKGSEPAPVRLHLFADDGSYLNRTTLDEKGQIVWEGTPLPKEITEVGGVGFAPGGVVYLATNRGLARFSLSVTPVGQSGVYYSKVLDNGSPEGLWHRVALAGRIPDKTSVEVYYHASDDAALKRKYEDLLSWPYSAEVKERRIKKWFETPAPKKPLWKGPEIFKGAAGRDASEPDMLTVENKGRYLWLKLRLVTFDEKSRPSVRTARVYYPRQSYLRYLPPLYREDTVSAAFLERFLAIFESVFQGIEGEIDGLHRYFDPALAPEGFLRWLGSWINLSVEQELPAERVRRLIRRAPDLYGRKGTPSALAEFLEIYTGRPVYLTEHLRHMRPLVLGSRELQLGLGTLLFGSGLRGFRLGDTSVAGFSAVRDRVGDPDEPFLPAVRRFRVLIDMERDEFERRAPALRRILEEQKPAHTSFTLGLVADEGAAGAAVLGVSAAVAGTEPYRVGVTPLSGAYTVNKGPEALRVGRGAWVGSSEGL